MPRHCAAVAMETQRIRSVSTSGQQSGASRLKIIPLANLRRPGGADSFSGKPFPSRECESPDRGGTKPSFLLTQVATSSLWGAAVITPNVTGGARLSNHKPSRTLRLAGILTSADMRLPALAWLILKRAPGQKTLEVKTLFCSELRYAKLTSPRCKRQL